MPVRLVAVAAASLCLSACFPIATTLHFKRPGLDREQWNRIQKECAYEAEKATAANSSGAVLYRWRLVYIACAELKGAEYLGYTREPETTWARIGKLCTDEATAATAGIPASVSRDEVWLARRLECIKRSGVTLYELVPG
jgi:hypothetical protein